MAQSLKLKVRKLAEQFNINAIISTAQEVQMDMADAAAWDALSNQQRLDWFNGQCAKYGLTISQRHNQLRGNRREQVFQKHQQPNAKVAQ